MGSSRWVGGNNFKNKKEEIGWGGKEKIENK
jgi:hypothetical protein